MTETKQAVDKEYHGYQPLCVRERENWIYINDALFLTYKFQYFGFILDFLPTLKLDITDVPLVGINSTIACSAGVQSSCLNPLLYNK